MEHTKTKRVLLVFSDEDTRNLLENNVLAHQDFMVTSAKTTAEAKRAAAIMRPDVMVLGDDLPDGDHLELAESLLELQPTLPIILFTQGENTVLPREAIRLGLVDWLKPPIAADDFRQAVARGLERSRHWHNWLRLESARYTGPLMQQMDELKWLAKVGRSVTAEQDIDGILTTVVEAAVELAGADSGSILLLDNKSGELYMRASRNFQDEFVKTFRLPVEDTLAGDVIRTGEPILMGENSPLKIKTAFLVYSMIYVPLKVGGKPFGVLSVENSATQNRFTPRQVTLLSTLADYAAIALENANLYQETELERRKQQNILTQIKDGVIILDPQEKILLVNETVCAIYDLTMSDMVGKTLEEVFVDEDLVKAIRGETENSPYGLEVNPKEGYFYSVQVSDISGVGTVATLHDIAHLKELDRVKTEFISMVSHDLRSPLTSILGYIELIGRVGEVNEQQQKFINRVVASVNIITNLINDLLHLGQLELGVEKDMERVNLIKVIEEVVDSVSHRIDSRQQILAMEFSVKDIPIIANRIQMRQVVDNLLSNAIKYTPISGLITIYATVESGQAIISVIDNGPGIPSEEQSQIFDKFYRGKNAPPDVQGTGLGLAITKTIVEKHDGRIWVESSSTGSRFTVVMPTSTTKD